jgi:hypothetical protein
VRNRIYQFVYIIYKIDLYLRDLIITIMLRLILYLLFFTTLYIYCAYIINERVRLLNFAKFISFASIIIFIITYNNIDYRIAKCKPDPGFNCLFDTFNR